MSQGGAWRRFFVRALLVLILLVLAAASGGFFYLKSRISPEAISAEVSEILRRKFGYNLTVDELHLTWTGNAELRRICVRNEAMQSARCFISADVLHLDLKLLPLLQKQIEIRGAELDNCELNLFAETLTLADGKKITRNSWETAPASPPKTPQEPGDAGASSLTMRLNNLVIRNAVVAHEVRILPLPPGRTELSLNLRHGGKSLSLQAMLPDKSRVSAALALDIADFLATGRLLATGLHLAGQDRVSGAVECEDLNLSTVDSRATALSGKLHVEAISKEIKISAEGAQLSTRLAYAPSLVWKGNVTLSLPDLNPSAGEGRFTGQGLAIDYRSVSYLPKSGMQSEFDVSADISSLPGIAGLRGIAVMHGEFKNHAISANFSLRQFTASASGLAVSADRLDGALQGNRIFLRGQTVLLAGNPAKITLEAEPFSRPIRVEGSAEFSELRLDDFLVPAQPADASQTKAPAQDNSTAGRLRAALRVSASSLLIGKLKTGEARAQLYTDGSSTQVKSWHIEFGQGRMQGSYEKRSDGMHSLAFRLYGVKAQSLNALLGFKAQVYGSIDADGKLSFRGNSSEAVLKSGNGQLNLRLGRGKIRDSFLQKGVLSGPLHKLEEKFSDVEFASAQAELRLSPNKISVQKFYFDAEEWNVTYRAESDSDWQGKAALLFRFRSSFVENVANPLHMGISDRKDGEFYDLPFACRGAVLTGDCYRKNW